MRFEPYDFTTEEEYQSVVKDIRSWDSGDNFEQSCRLWYTKNGRTVMVEHDVATLTAFEITNEDVSDFLTVYLVSDENDYDTSEEIWTEEIFKYITLDKLKESMEVTAICALNKLEDDYRKEKEKNMNEASIWCGVSNDALIYYKTNKATAKEAYEEFEQVCLNNGINTDNLHVNEVELKDENLDVFEVITL